jgi:AAA+ ATPase superfamily predicted ATPase
MVFIGREYELQTLNRLADQPGFHMCAVYGRRRIGKTALLSRFCENRKSLWFTAREQSSAGNLRDFSQAIYRFFSIPAAAGSMANWMDALNFIAQQAKKQLDQPFVFVFDEFPYAALSERSLPSIFQIAIDHVFKDTNVTLILCGSNEGFMESDVMSSKSPLYGRRNAQIKLQAFDVFDAVKFLPAASSWEDKVNYYAALGGTPYYLEQIDHSLSFAQNIANLCFSMSGILYEEPAMLMRQELREPALYNSLLDAIGAGCTKPKEIAEHAGVDHNSVGAYLKTLQSLGLIERTVPFGDNPASSRKGLWGFRDPFFAYWYRFVSPATALIETGTAQAAARYATSGEVFSTYVGHQFESICLQWLLRQCRQGRIDFSPTSYGRWWGNDSEARAQADIDIVMADSLHRTVLLGECKWRNSINETEAIETLKRREKLISTKGRRSYYFFTKNPPASSTRDKSNLGPSLTIVDAATMLADQNEPHS